MELESDDQECLVHSKAFLSAIAVLGLHFIFILFISSSAKPPLPTPFMTCAYLKSAFFPLFD